MTTTCPGCGQPVDLSRRGYCALCGTNVACVPEGGQVKFLRYVCMYCCARLIFNGLRSVARRPACPATPCKQHKHGVLLTLALLPFVASACLIVLGFVLR
jgi:hypothetical protein